MNRILDILHAWRQDRRGNVALIAALAMPVVLGSLGLGAEVASWYGGKRLLQNAADSAATAAATNASAGYDREALAVAAQYGFRNGVGGVSVAALNNQTCPGGGNNCYKVTITKVQPLVLAQAIGLAGDTNFNGSPAKLLSAKATAIQAKAPREYCILALAGSGATQGIRTNGAPFANLAGCNIMSNTDSDCNGHDLNADWGDAHGVNNGCGKKRTSNVNIVSDPYAALKSNIPADTCGGVYPMAPAKKKDPPLPSSNLLHGLDSRSVINICGDVELSGPTFLNSNANTVLIVRNGSLNPKGYTLQTNPGTSLTIVFTGSNNARSHAPLGSGAFDFQAPSTGPWKGIAIYQDPTVTGGVDISAAGNSPAWSITGMVYLPHSSVTFSGAVNKSSNGASCFGMVIDNLRVNGTAEILAHGQCAAAGLILPRSLQPSRGQLVS